MCPLHSSQCLLCISLELAISGEQEWPHGSNQPRANHVVADGVETASRSPCDNIPFQLHVKTPGHIQPQTHKRHQRVPDLFLGFRGGHVNVGKVALGVLARKYTALKAPPMRRYEIQELGFLPEPLAGWVIAASSIRALSNSPDRQIGYEKRD